MADYEYQIFISYRRSDEHWVKWTRENFVQPLRTLLRPALGNVRIFVDEQIETGQNWPRTIAEALAKSRIMIPILSRDYFTSDWCRLEIALMRERAIHLGWEEQEGMGRLILPVVIDDGDSFPDEVKAIQCKKIHEFANPFILPNSPKQEAFAEKIREWCPIVIKAVGEVPAYDPDFMDLTYKHALHLFQSKAPSKVSVPRLTLPLIP
jgi:hypothetical protein